MSEIIDSQNFDPYHKWLAIPPKDQPPNHYRMLAIDLFESDQDVIGNAADQRMSHLKSFQAGPYGKLSQKLLNEIAAARTCLLNADQKLRYDASLRGGLLDVVDAVEDVSAAEPGAAPAAAAPAGARPSASTTAPRVQVATDGRPPRGPGGGDKKPKKANAKRDFKINVIGHIIAPILGLLLGYVVLSFILPNYSIFGSSDDGNGIAGSDGELDGDADADVDGSADGRLDDTDGSADGKADGGHSDTTDSVTDGSPAADGSAPTNDGTVDGETDGAADGAADGATDGATTSSDDSVDGGDPTTDGAADGATDGTDPPPDGPTLEERQLAALEEQRDRAIAAGNVQEALDAVGGISVLKEKDPITAQIQALGSYRDKAKSPDDFKTIVRATLALIDAAVAADRAAEAKKLATVALGDARRSNDQALINRATLKFIELK